MTDAKATLRAALAAHGITMTATFVPWSQSRNKEEKDDRGNPRRTLNWRVTIKRRSPVDGQDWDILTTDYSAGEGHCLSYKAMTRRTVDYDAALLKECETGRSHGKAILPDLCDVMHSLLLEASVLDAGGFEGWASDFGYDTDSRKAESIYRACLDLALKMRAGLDDAVIAELQTAAEGY